jgi:hypothetical protein
MCIQKKNECCDVCGGTVLNRFLKGKYEYLSTSTISGTNRTKRNTIIFDGIK